MLGVVLISLTAVGFVIYAISTRPVEGSRLWEFTMKNAEGEKVNFHVRSNDYESALKSAMQILSMHNQNSIEFKFSEIYELNPMTQGVIDQVMIDIKEPVTQNSDRV